MSAPYDDRVRPMLLAQAAKRDAYDWNYDDAQAVIADLIARTDLLPPPAADYVAGPWQSVDSAPKDGTEFVACLGPTGFTEYAIMMWNDDEDDWTDTSGAIIGVPERWMQIPALAARPASPDTRVVAKGLTDDTTGLGRFGHHPDPAIDFEIEVEGLQGRLFDAINKISKPGEAPEPISVVADAIDRAMTFTVGGDPSAVLAKHFLRGLDKQARAILEGGQDRG